MTKMPINVLVVDDSALMRKLLTEIINSSPSLQVVAVAKDAIDARQKIKQYNPDVLTLDVEMPGMDGISFLAKIMQLRPMPVVMISTLTEKGAEATFQALSIGAVDFVAKPKVDLKKNLTAYTELIIEKVTNAAYANVGQDLGKSASAKKEPAPKESPGTQNSKGRAPSLTAIGASTGGTIALEKIITLLPADAPPVVIVQHIPPVYSAAFANRLNKKSKVEVREAKDGDKIKRGLVLIAPGDFHMEVTRNVVRLNQHERVSGHRPSVNVLFRSIINNKNCLAVLLTGMGSDGAEGLKELHDNGTTTIAQDEESSLIWGMPQRAIELGGASKVVHLDNIHRYLSLMYTSPGED